LRFNTDLRRSFFSLNAKNDNSGDKTKAGKLTGSNVLPGITWTDLKGERTGCYTPPKEGLCLEPQMFPSGLEHPEFPSPILRKGEKYYFLSVYKFT